MLNDDIKFLKQMHSKLTYIVLVSLWMEPIYYLPSESNELIVLETKVYKINCMSSTSRLSLFTYIWITK